MTISLARIATVSSPVFWGSFFGITFTSILGGLSYLQVVDVSLPKVTMNENGFVVFFLCLLCVRYYASIIFLTYKDSLTTEIQSLASPARKSVFWVQFLLIFGCCVNASVLPVFGASTACLIVMFQGILMMKYWRIVWSTMFTDDPTSDYHVLILIGDFAILLAAIFYFLWESGFLVYDRGAAGFFLGAIFIVFVGECSTNYFRAIRTFVRETRNSLRV